MRRPHPELAPALAATLSGESSEVVASDRYAVLAMYLLEDLKASEATTSNFLRTAEIDGRE
jgi:hypothetical protein